MNMLRPTTSIVLLGLTLGACISGDPKVVAACKNSTKLLSGGKADRAMVQECVDQTEGFRSSIEPAEFDRRLECWTNAESSQEIVDCVPKLDEPIELQAK